MWLRYLKANERRCGGFICMSSNSTHSAVRPEDYVEMVKTIREYGKYPLTFASRSK